MSTKYTSATKKVVAGFVGFAMAISFVFGGAVSPAQAQTVEELAATIATLKATIAGLVAQLDTMQGGTTTTTAGTGYTFTRSLKQGDTGADVMELQKFLNRDAATQVSVSGAGSPGNESSYFGPATKAAVVKFQNKYAASVLAPVGLSAGTGYFGPSSIAKANMLNVATTPTNPTDPTTPPVVTGPVSVVLSGDTPASGYVIDGQATADLAHFTFTGVGTVTSVTLKRTGISDQNTLSNVYLYDGVNRITDGYSFNSVSEMVINGLNIAVSGAKTISVKADAASDASNDSTIAVTLTSVTANGTTNAVNVSGNEMYLASGDSLATASISANTYASTRTVNAGTSEFTFWSAPIQINTRAVNLKVANFRMIGSAPSDAVANIHLYVDGVDTGKVASVISITGSNYAVFDLTSSPLSLSTGSHTVDVRGTVEKGSDRTIQFSLQQAADLMITDPQVGVNVAVSGTVPNSAGSVTINQGSVTVNLDPTFQSLTTVTGGASDVTIAKFKIHAYGEDVKFNTLQILPVLGTMTPTASGLDNVAIYFNGSQVGSQQDWSSSALTFTPGSQMIAPAGVDSTLEVRADIRTSASTNYTAGTVSANMVVGSSNAQGQNSKSTLSTPAVTGNTLTVQTGLLAVAKNNAFANTNIQPNQAGVKIASFTLQNQSSSEAVRLTSLVVDPIGAGTAATTDISGLRTSLTSGSGATPQQPQSSNTFSVNQTLSAGQTLTLDILADTGSATTTSFIPTLNVTSIGVNSNVSATSGAITGQTVTLAVGTVATPTLVSGSQSTTVAQLIPAANGGAMNASKATFNFTSTGGASTISELKFTDSTSVATYAHVGNSLAPFVGGVAYLTGLNLQVPLGNSGLNQLVTFDYPEVGTSGIDSMSTSTVSVTYVKYASGGTTSTLTPSVAAPTMVLVGSMPSFSTIDSSDVLTNGQVKIAEFKVTADAKGDIKLGGLPISVRSSGAVTVATSTDNIVVKDSSGTVISTTNTSFGVYAGGTGTTTIAFGATSGTSDLIPAGSSKTYFVYVTPSSVPASADPADRATLYTKLGAAASVEWYDVAGANTTAIDAASVLNYSSMSATESAISSN